LASRKTAFSLFLLAFAVVGYGGESEEARAAREQVEKLNQARETQRLKQTDGLKKSFAQPYPEDAAKPAETVPPTGPNKLNAPSRALNPAEGTPGSAVAEKPLVVIYYANESTPDAAEVARIQSLMQWLRESGNGEIAASADGIDKDL